MLFLHQKKKKKKKSLTNVMLAEGKGSLLVLENNFIEVTLVLCGDFFFLIFFFYDRGYFEV